MGGLSPSVRQASRANVSRAACVHSGASISNCPGVVHKNRRVTEGYLSVLKISATAFQLLSACFCQTTTYLPCVLVGLPVASLVVSWKVPMS